MEHVSVPPSPLTGGCLCGAIRFTVSRAPGAMTLCHCRQCRKTAGAPFLAVVPVPADAFELEDRERCLREFRATPNKARCFCLRCGAPVYSRRDGTDSVRVRAALFDHLPDVTAAVHIFTAEAAPWDASCDAWPRYAGIEPERR